MTRRFDNERKENSATPSNNQGQRNQQVKSKNISEGQRNIPEGRRPMQDNARTTQEPNHQRDPQNKSYQREGFQRHNHTNQFQSSRPSMRVKPEETVEDIQTDISRIEKEIELEIKEIKTMRLGL